MEDGENLTESVNRALRVLRFTVHTRLKKTPLNYTTEENRELN